MLKTWWRRLWAGAGSHPVAGWQVVMYTRQGCHLCEEAWGQLEEARKRHGFALRSVDIDADPELVQRFTDCVPVVEINGRVRFRGRINPVLFRRMLHGGSDAAGSVSPSGRREPPGGAQRNGP